MSASVQTRPVEVAAPEAEPVSRHRATPRAHITRLPQVLLGIFCVALAMRIYNISTSYNIFIDEVLYSQVGDNVAEGRGITLFGNAFNLHPPAPFAFLAGAVRLFGLADGTTSPDTLLLQLRPVTAVFGSLTVVAVFLVMRRCGASPVVTVATTAVVMADPFQISFDSRVMLEAFAQFFAITAVGLLLVLQARAESGRGRRFVLAGAGIAAGLVLGTKETFGLVVVVMLLLLLVCPRLVPRRTTLTVLATAAVTYVLVVSAAWFGSGFGPWFDDKTSGLRRLIGTEQTTGFNANATDVTLADRIFANVGEFGATYAILVAGGIVTIVDIVRRRPWRSHHLDAFQRARSLVSLWNVCACGYLVYATLIGSIEEQMYYIPLVPCILSLGLAAAAARGRLRFGRVLAVLVAATLVFQAGVWVHTHTHNQNLYENFLVWQRSHVLTGSRIGVTDEPASFMVKNAAIGTWHTIAELRENRADYVLVDSSLVEQGYSKMPKSTFRYLQKHAPVAYRSEARGDTLYFFDLRGPY